MNKLRPYEPLNMTTKKWKEIEPVMVDIKVLIPSQIHLSKEILPKGHSFCGDPHIHVVHFNSKFYISDGHHRVSEKLINGEEKIAARIFKKTE